MLHDLVLMAPDYIQLSAIDNSTWGQVDDSKFNLRSRLAQVAPGLV